MVVDREFQKISFALAHIRERGNLDGLSATRNEKLAFVRIARQRGLVAWERARQAYRVTRKGRRFCAKGSRKPSLNRKLRAGVGGIAISTAAICLVGLIWLDTNYPDSTRAPHTALVGSASPVSFVMRTAPRAVTPTASLTSNSTHSGRAEPPEVTASVPMVAIADRSSGTSPQNLSVDEIAPPDKPKVTPISEPNHKSEIDQKARGRTRLQRLEQRRIAKRQLQRRSIGVAVQRENFGYGWDNAPQSILPNGHR